jgi:hypothetical protein
MTRKAIANDPEASDIPEPFPDLRSHTTARSSKLRWQLLEALDRRHQESGTNEARGIDRDCVRSAERTYQYSGETGAGYLRCGAADFELRVALTDLVSLDERRQIRLIRDVEEHGQHSSDKPDCIELTERECACEVSERDRGKRGGSAPVRRDKDWTPPQPVDPHARGKAEQHERQELDDAESGDLEGACVEDEDRRQGQRQVGDLAPELAHGLSRPQTQEIAVPPEQTAWAPPARPR